MGNRQQRKIEVGRWAARAVGGLAGLLALVALFASSPFTPPTAAG